LFQGVRRNLVLMKKTSVIKVVEGWVDSDASKAEATMLKILNTALEVI